MIKLVGIWLFEWLWCLSNLIIKPRMLSYKRGFQREVNCGKLDPKVYETWDKQRFLLRADYGYMLSCELLEGKKDDIKGNAKDNTEDNIEDNTDDNTEDNMNETISKKIDKIVILCHGLGYAKYSSIKYVEMFFGLGFKVLIYDHRNHGNSGKAFTSMGYFEKYDLRRIVDWCCEKYGSDCRIVTHGESMGAATVLMHLDIDSRVDLAIADCAYSDLKQLLCHQLKQFYHLPCFLIPVESLITYLRAGFWYREVSPIRVVEQTEIPILFIHGKIDNLVPADMSKQMYAHKKKKKAIYLVAGARHAQSFCTNKEGYERIVSKFIKTYL